MAILSPIYNACSSETASQSEALHEAVETIEAKLNEVAVPTPALLIKFLRFIILIYLFVHEKCYGAKVKKTIDEIKANFQSAYYQTS